MRKCFKVQASLSIHARKDPSYIILRSSVRQLLRQQNIDAIQTSIISRNLAWCNYPVSYHHTYSISVLIVVMYPYGPSLYFSFLYDASSIVKVP